MDDALIVCGLERVGHLPGYCQCFVDRNRAFPDTVSERRPFDQLHHQRARVHAVARRAIGDAVDLGDVGVIQRRQRPRFTIEACQALRIGGN